jgi:carbonic anhydrase/acetyltransferase-like protein (isoleucine patch superfamily)
LIGQGAIIQKGSIIEPHSIVAAGSVVLPGTLIPTKQLWAGNPAKYIRDVTDEEMEHIEMVGR